MKKIAILQSNYIPWKGVFDLINSVDEFVLYDDVQYTKRDWRNRNQIKTHTGFLWLTIPIKKANRVQDIKDTLVNGHAWCESHWKSLQQFFKKAPYFERYAPEIKAMYTQCASVDHLSNINYNFYQLINDFLGITTPISWSMDYHLTQTEKNMRLIELCYKAGATHYLSGPNGRNYIDAEIWQKNKITVDFFSYNNYPEYPQLFGPFEHNVSVLDLLFHTGPHANKFMLSFKKKKTKIPLLPTFFPVYKTPGHSQ